MNKYTIEQQAENRAKWVKALRSGDYKQGTGRLGDSDNGFCCLGVACEIAQSEGVIQSFLSGDSLPAIGVLNWLGLTNESGFTNVVEAYEGSEYDLDQMQSLTELNDAHELTFNDIADLIEEGSVEVVGSEWE